MDHQSMERLLKRKPGRYHFRGEEELLVSVKILWIHVIHFQIVLSVFIIFWNFLIHFGIKQEIDGFITLQVTAKPSSNKAYLEASAVQSSRRDSQTCFNLSDCQPADLATLNLLEIRREQFTLYHHIHFGMTNSIFHEDTLSCQIHPQAKG